MLSAEMLAMGFNPIASSCIEECIASPVFVGALSLTRVPHYVMLLARVIGTFPTANATGVAPTTNVTATFSEDMLVSSINGNTFKLTRKGSTTQLPATISYDAATDTATLDPTSSLQRRVTYKAVVTTGAKDLAGNSLNQNSTVTGSPQMAWLFTVRQ